MEEQKSNIKRKSSRVKPGNASKEAHGILFTPTLTKDQKIISEWNTTLRVRSYDEVEEFIRNKNLLNNSVS
jgi:hypothetical protein